MQTFRPRITLDGEMPSPMNHLQCRPWNQANRAVAYENPKPSKIAISASYVNSARPPPLAPRVAQF